MPRMDRTKGHARQRQPQSSPLANQRETDGTDGLISHLFTTVLSSSLDKKDLIQVMLRETLTSGSFIDTKFFAFSKRRAGGGVDDPLPVYANSRLLMSSSRYFDGLFGADFAENRIASLDNEFPADKKDLMNLYDYDSDSDLDDDIESIEHPTTEEQDAESSSASQVVHEGKQREPDAEDKAVNVDLPERISKGGEQFGRTIVISDIAFRTWKAFIFYLYTGEVAFSPLRSQPDRTKAQTKSTAPRCSPKSMYRLADKYDIPDLRTKAEKAIIDQLCTENIVQELRSSATAMYDKIREKEVAYACKGPPRPIVLSGIAQWITDLTNGEIPHTARTLYGVVQGLAGAPTVSSVSKTCGNCGRTHPSTNFQCTACRGWNIEFPN